ncbi:MAG: hypothetical protein ACI9Q3_001155 [Maribacter sp.]|jgi:hypothetical protein
MKNWIEELKEVLENKTKNFSNQEKENISYRYLTNLILKIETGIISETDELKSKIEFIINEMPYKTGGTKIIYNTNHLNEISNLQTFVEENFKLIKAGTFQRRYMMLGIPLGMPLGLPFGAALENIGLSLIIGMPIGMITGFLIGNYLDKKTEKENRTI